MSLKKMDKSCNRDPCPFIVLREPGDYACISEHKTYAPQQFQRMICDPQFHHPVRRNLEESRQTAGIAEHDGKEQDAPIGHFPAETRNQRFPTEEERGVHHVEFESEMGAQGKRCRQIRFVLETVLDRHLPETFAEIGDFNAVDLRHMGHIENAQGDDHHPLVQHLVVLETVQHGARHALRPAGQEDGGSEYARGTAQKRGSG